MTRFVVVAVSLLLMVALMLVPATKASSSSSSEAETTDGGISAAAGGGGGGGGTSPLTTTMNSSTRRGTRGGKVDHELKNTLVRTSTTTEGTVVKGVATTTANARDSNLRRRELGSGDYAIGGKKKSGTKKSKKSKVDDYDQYDIILLEDDTDICGAFLSGNSGQKYMIDTGKKVVDCGALGLPGPTVRRDATLDCDGVKIVGVGTGTGITLEDNASVENCVVEDYGSGFLFSTGSGIKTLSNSKAKNVGSAGVEIQGSGLNNLVNVEIEGDVDINFAKDGIFIQYYAGDVNITNPIIKNAGKGIVTHAPGPTFYSNELTIINPTIENVRSDSIFFRGDEESKLQLIGGIIQK